MKFMPAFTFLLALTSLSGCVTTPSRSSDSPTPKNEIVGATELITNTMIEVKQGTAIIDRFFIAKKATVESTDSLERYAIHFSPVFRSLDDFVALFKSHCDGLQGDFRHAICWNKERSQIHFVAEGYVTEYSSDNFHKILLNILEPKAGIDMVEFADDLANLAHTLPAIKFASKDLSRFSKLQRLEMVYDDLALQVKSLVGFQDVPDNELLQAAKALHDALNNKTARFAVWHAGEDVFGRVAVVEKFTEGNQSCANIEMFRNQGLDPTFRDIITGDNGESTNTNTLCTELDDRDGFGWHFVS